MCVFGVTMHQVHLTLTYLGVPETLQCFHELVHKHWSDTCKHEKLVVSTHTQEGDNICTLLA